MMEVGVCALCERFLTSPLESTQESFRPTLTLQRTLEMLSTGSSVSKFDAKTLFNDLTSEEGSSICFNCSSILHTGLQVTSQILLLESRLKNLGARIRTTEVTQTCVNNRLVRKRTRNKTPSDFSFSKFFFGSSKVSSSNNKTTQPPDNKNGVKNEDTDTENKTQESWNESTSSEEFQPQTKRESARYPRSEQKNLKPPQTPLKGHKSRDIAQISKRSRPSSKSPSSFPSRTRTASPRRKHPPGVQICPSCDLSVDARSPSQVNSSKPLAYSVREFLRKKSREKLLFHFRDSHMASTAKDNFKISSDGLRTYFCPEPNCNFTHAKFVQMVSHFMQSHAKIDASQSSAASEPSTYSCPEENCSFTVEVSQIPRGINAQRQAKDTLVAHVFFVHDIPAQSLLKTSNKRIRDNSLFVDVGSGKERRTVYRCTRCEDYEDQLPLKNASSLSRLQYKVSRIAFLRHFFDNHLS